MNKMNKQAQATMLKQIDDNRVRFRLTSLKVDRHGEVVMPDGIILDNYKKNPIVLFGHGWDINQGDMPIGKIDIASMEITKDYVDADIIFDVANDSFAAMVFGKVRDGFLNAGSIGFHPKEINTDAILEDQTGATYTKWELLEFSIVYAPSNTDAVAMRSLQDEMLKAFPDRKKSIESAFNSAEDKEQDNADKEQNNANKEQLIELKAKVVELSERVDDLQKQVIIRSADLIDVMTTLKGGLEEKDIEVIDTFEDNIKLISDDISLSAEDLAEIEANLNNS